MSTVAIDCDLRKMYAVDDTDRVLLKAAPELTDNFLDTLRVEYGTVLFEIASAADYTDNPGAAHNKRRWTIFNVYQATRLAAYFHAHNSVTQLLVAPSSKWTHGHSLTTRHMLAGCKQKQKDLRECEAMLWFYDRMPTDWVPLDLFIASL
jgi:hypothetical protein